MDPKAIQADIKNYKIRQGPLYKRSKFLKEWRERWIVLTSNFLYTFSSKSLEEVTDVIDLKQIKSYKSYLRKDEEMIPPGFKIRSADDQYYFCAKNCNQKWSWLVSLERLMDYKYVGTSSYNNADWIKTRGFESQVEFESAGSKHASQGHPDGQKGKGLDEAKKDVDAEAEKIMKQLQEQQKELQKKKEQLEKKQANFVLEQKRIEEEKLRQQKQASKKLEESKKPAQEPPKPQESPKKVEESAGGSLVSQLRKQYESKMSDPKDNLPKYDVGKGEKKVEKKDDQMHIHRANAIQSLFEEFTKEAAFTFGLKYVTDFIVNVCSDSSLGYATYVVIQGKTNQNRKNFSEVFIQLLGVFDEYQKCENLMKFIETCIFQIPGLFDAAQTAVIQRKLKQIFLSLKDQTKLGLVIKNMFIMNKLCKYQRADISQKLDKILKEFKNEETRNWAKKLLDDI